jgi:putative DNA methylase
MSENIEATDLRPTSAIETEFPFQQLNELAALESYNKHHYRPTNYQHKWWARRLGSVFRMITIATLSDAETESDELWSQYGDSLNFDDSIVFDPFMGGGTTGQEVTRTGAKFVGADVNPVAWYVSKMGLQEQTPLLEMYYRQVINRSRDDIQPYFKTECPHCDKIANVGFYLWVKEGEYTDKNDEVKWIRDYDSLVVNNHRDGSAVVVCPDRGCSGITLVDDPENAICADCETKFDATDSSSLPITNCERDKIEFSADAGIPRYVPYAIKYRCKECEETGFSKFSGFDQDRLNDARDRFDEIKDELPLPEQRIPDGEKTGDLLNRGYTHWQQMFFKRQLLSLGTLLKHITDVPERLAREYLLLTFSSALEFNNKFCSFKGSNSRSPGAVRHIFSHHAYVHPQEPLENNPLGALDRQSGTFRYLYEYRLKKSLDYQFEPVERVLDSDGTVDKKKCVHGRIGGDPADSIEDLRSQSSSHYLYRGDSTHLPFTDEITGEIDAVITDPPYYDSVQYSELADFFYVWLRIGLKDDYPDQFDSKTILKNNEVVGNKSRNTLLDDYRDMMQSIFRKCFNIMKDNAPLVFTFHHKSPDVWGALLESLDGAGFRVVQTYPVRGENRLSVHINGQRAVLLDSVIVCRKDHKKPAARWETVYEEIEHEARERIREFHEETDDDDLSRLDSSVVARGACMTAYSRYERVTDNNGKVTERDAMQRVQTLIDGLNDEEF